MPSQYPQNVVTKNGLAMIAESIATRKNLIFTRVVVGDGDATGRNFNDMTSVISPKMELPVTSGVNEGNGQYLITATLSNNTLNVGFFPREVGLYAKVDGKTEMLYSYTNGGNNVGYVPDKTTPIDSEIYKIRTVIGNAKNITINMSDSTFVTKGELDRYVSITSGSYVKDANRTNTGLSVIKGDNTSKAIDFITANYNDSDTNKVINLAALKVLLGQGGIVASKLDGNNGYVKFANGFIIQWGITVGNDPGAGGARFNFPIAFSNRNYIAIANGHESTVNLGGLATWADSNTYVTIDNQDSRFVGKYKVIAMGV